ELAGGEIEHALVGIPFIDVQADLALDLEVLQRHHLAVLDVPLFAAPALVLQQRALIDVEVDIHRVDGHQGRQDGIVGDNQVVGRDLNAIHTAIEGRNVFAEAEVEHG